MAVRIARRIFSREGISALLLVCLASAACVGLGFWQWHRYEAKSERAAIIQENYDAAPVPLDAVLPDPDAPLDPLDTWTQVELTGSYCTDPDCVLYVRNRAYGQLIGFWQLVPFETEHSTVLVVRGWVDTTGTGSEPASEPPIPDGPATVVVRLRPAETVLPGRTNPPGQVQTITPAQIQPLLPPGMPPLQQSAYGVMAAEDPVVSPLPRAPEAPDTGLGPHLAYTFQWWLFALFFPVALVIRTRRSLLDEDADEAAVTAEGSAGAAQGATGPAAGAAPRAVSAEARALARRRSQDEEEEDALVDRRSR